MMIKEYSNCSFMIDNKLKEIADYISNLETQSVSDYGIMGGLSGHILFLFYYSKYSKKIEYNLMGKRLIEKVRDYLDKSESVSFNYADGVTGFLVTIIHLIAEGYLESDFFEIDTEIDEAIYNICLIAIQNKEDDFFYGSAGLYFYLLQRYKLTRSNLIAKYLNELIVVFYKREEENQFKPSGCFFEISMPHGYSSWMILIVMTAELGLESIKCGELMDMIYFYYSPFILSDFDGDSFFPEVIPITGVDSVIHSRLGWCYGDLPCSLALLAYAEYTDNTNLKEKILAILVETSNRKNLDINSVFDACVCHGTSGLGAMFDVLASLYPCEQFNKASEFWIKETFKMGHFTDGIVGYKKMNMPDGKVTFSNEDGLLEGVVGIGLSMLTYISVEFAQWTKLLLIKR